MERAALIAVDTNVLLRFTLKDDPVQASAARDFFVELTPSRPAFISIPVLCEFAWVLSRSYRQTRDEIAHVIEGFLRTSVVRMERDHVIRDALELFIQSKAGFGDCCIAAVASASRCEYTVTFDKVAAKLPGVRLLA